MFLLKTRTRNSIIAMLGVTLSDSWPSVFQAPEELQQWPALDRCLIILPSIALTFYEYWRRENFGGERESSLISIYLGSLFKR